MAELFSEQSYYSRNEQVCQGVKSFERSNGLDTAARKIDLYRAKCSNGINQFNSIHFICQSVMCNCKYVTLKNMNITDSRESPTKVQ